MVEGAISSSSASATRDDTWPRLTSRTIRACMSCWVDLKVRMSFLSIPPEGEIVNTRLTQSKFPTKITPSP
jgi:hypothetical protein